MSKEMMQRKEKLDSLHSILFLVPSVGKLVHLDLQKLFDSTLPPA